jgi:tryptophan-rich sensory protein
MTTELLCTNLYLTASRERESYITTNGQMASLSWCQAPIWGLQPDFYYCQTIAGLLMWVALSDEKTGLSFTMYNVQYVYILHVILCYSFTNLT